MLTPLRTARFKRDLKLVQKRHKDMEKLKAVILTLLNEEPLAASLKDHPLRGEWQGFRDLHIEPDWLLVYCVDNNVLQLARTGTHADLFDA